MKQRQEEGLRKVEEVILSLVGSIWRDEWHGRRDFVTARLEGEDELSFARRQCVLSRGASDGCSNPAR